MTESWNGLLLGMGNPLLDISVNVDQALLDKYGLQMGNAILAEDKHLPLYPELAAKADVLYVAGGATQNSIRVAQWVLNKTHGKEATAYMGSVGPDDEYAKVMQGEAEKAGVHVRYFKSDKPTGTCAVAVHDNERSLCANLSAANDYKAEHLEQNIELLNKAKVVYSSGFFMTVCPDAMYKCADVCAADAGKTYCLNLGAPFLIEVPPLKAVLDKLLPNVDILFGNETEAQTLAKVEGWGENLSVLDIAKKAAAMPKANGKPRRVVFTQGADDVIVVDSTGEATQFPVKKLEKSQLVDTNGAGDSFVGGYLAGLVAGKPLEKCVEAGVFAATVVVQRGGCTVPEACDYEL